MRSGLVSPKVVGRTLALVVLLCAGTNYTRSTMLEQGIWDSPTEGFDLTLRLVREGILWALALALLNGLVVHKRRLTGGLRLAPGVCVVTMAAVASLSATWLLNPQPPMVVVAGLRIVPLLLILAALVHYSPGERRVVGVSVMRAASVLIFFEAVWAAIQINVGIPPLFGTTFAGPRPFGTFATPNLLGMAALGVMVLAVEVRTRLRPLVMVACLAVIFVSGSRTAMLGTLLVLLGSQAGRVRLRWLLVPNAAVLAFVAYRGVSSEDFSGRVITGEGRLEVWESALAQAMGGALDWLFGAGVGYGSNAAATLGDDVVVTDSVFIAALLSFGLLGLGALLVGLVFAGRRLGDRAWVVLPVALLVGLTVNLPEVAPINVLLLVAAGVAWPECECRSGEGDDAPGGQVEHVGGTDRVGHVRARDHRG